MTISGNIWIFLITGGALVCYIAVAIALVRAWRTGSRAGRRHETDRPAAPVADVPAPGALEGTQLLVNPLGNAWLEIKVNGQSRVLPLASRHTIVGSRVPSDVQVDDPYVSGKHLGITVHPDGRTSVIDLDSTNGTFVNGVRVEKAFVGPEDEVRIGRTILRVVGMEKPAAIHDAA